MGLDISFYEKIEIVGAHPTEWTNEDGSYGECWSKTHSTAYVQDRDFPFTTRGLPKGSFHFDHTGQVHHWQASYGGYSNWRRTLYSLVRPNADITLLWHRQWDSDEEKREFPFLEILNFSDCEGAYGGEVAADLLKDFRDFLDAADKLEDEMRGVSSYAFYDQYVSYMEGLEKVGPNGLVTYG